MRGTAPSEFQRLIAANGVILGRVARIYCRSLDDQRDLVQEIYLQLWRSFPKYDPTQRFSTWAYRVALNVAISRVRSASYRSRYETPQPDGGLEAVAASVPETDPRLSALYAMLAELPELDRALVLLYLDGHTSAEMGEVLGITESNAATKISRLKAHLRQRAADAKSEE